VHPASPPASPPQAPDTYVTGTGDAAHCDATIPLAAAAADVQFWSLLADADPSAARKNASVTFALRNPGSARYKGGEGRIDGLWQIDEDLIGSPGGEGKGQELYGFRFTSWGNGIQWENTASAVMGLVHYQQKYQRDAPVAGLDEAISRARVSIRQLLQAYQAVPASVLGGNINAYIKNDHAADYPGGSDTGIGWTYLRYPHVAASTWAGLLLLYQHDDGAPVDDAANPFAPPRKPVPSKDKSDADDSCLPSGGGSGSKGGGGSPPPPSGGGGGGGGGGSPPPADAACKAHPGCSALTGECCPTAIGMMLECCGI